MRTQSLLNIFLKIVPLTKTSSFEGYCSENSHYDLVQGMQKKAFTKDYSQISTDSNYALKESMFFIVNQRTNANNGCFMHNGKQQGEKLLALHSLKSRSYTD